MASDLWVHTCTYLEKHYRKKRDENLGMQRVQVRTAIDRWTQDALQPGENPVEQWRQRSYESMTLLQLTIADLVSPRLRDTISQDLLATVDEVAGQQCELTTGVPNVGLDVVAPSVLSLAAGIGVVRGVVFVLDYSGVSLHGSWWILAAIVVGLMFMGIVAMLRYRQHEEKIQSLLITGVRSEMNRRVEELMRSGSSRALLSMRCGTTTLQRTTMPLPILTALSQLTASGLRQEPLFPVLYPAAWPWFWTTTAMPVCQPTQTPLKRW